MQFRITDHKEDIVFNADTVQDFINQVNYNILDFVDIDKFRYAEKRITELEKKYMEKVAANIPIENFHNSYIGMISKYESETKINLELQIQSSYLNKRWLIDGLKSCYIQSADDERIKQIYELLINVYNRDEFMCKGLAKITEFLSDKLQE